MPITIAPADKEKQDGVERDSKGRFLTGHKAAGPGRPKGSKHKLAEEFLADLYEKWKGKGAKAIDDMIAERPGDFVKVVASILPKDLNVNVNGLDELSDDQLLARIRQLDAAIIPALAAHGIDPGQGGTDGRAGDETTH